MGSVGQYTQAWLPWQGEKTLTGSWTRTNLGGSLGMGRYQNSPAINEDIIWEIYLDTGTWKFAAVIQTESDAAIITVQLNGATMGTIDGYSAGVVTGVYSEVTGMAVTVPAVTALRLVAASKNASSSNYFMLLNSIAVIRTSGTSSTPAGSDLPGYTWHFVPWMGTKSATGFGIRTQNSAYLGGGYLSSANPGAINDLWATDIWTDTGTYKLSEITVTDTNGGISTYTIGATSIGTVDHYNAAGANNVYTEITGVTISVAGALSFQDKMASKNGSSGGYMHRTQSIAWTRTGA